tara:strand:+ start:36 stop:266 length:231 start_codon:yes stop_codon:yes gene_type:complete
MELKLLQKQNKNLIEKLSAAEYTMSGQLQTNLEMQAELDHLQAVVSNLTRRLHRMEGAFREANKQRNELIRQTVGQ